MDTDFWYCHAWATCDVYTFAQQLNVGDEIIIVSFDNDDGSKGALPQCTLTKWTGVIHRAAVGGRCLVKYDVLDDLCHFPDPAVHHYALLHVSVVRSGESARTAAEHQHPLVPTVIPTATQFDRFAASSGCRVKCTCGKKAHSTKCTRELWYEDTCIAVRVPKALRIALGIARYAGSDVSTSSTTGMDVSIFGVVRECAPFFIDGTVDMSELREVDFRVPFRAITLEEERSVGEQDHLHRFVQRLIMSSMVNDYATRGRLVLIDLHRSSYHIIAAVDLPKPDLSHAVLPLRACILTTVPYGGFLLTTELEDQYPCIQASGTASECRHAGDPSRPPIPAAMLARGAGKALVGKWVEVTRFVDVGNATDVAPPSIPEVQTLMLPPDVWIAALECAVMAQHDAMPAATPLTASVPLPPPPPSFHTQRKALKSTVPASQDGTAAIAQPTSQSVAPTATSMRGAARRLGDQRRLQQLPDSSHAEAEATVQPDATEQPPVESVGSWVCRGQSAHLFFHPSLDIVASTGDGVVTVNRVAPMLIGGTSLRVSLNAAWMVNFTSVDFDVVDEDGDPIPSDVLTWTIDEDEDNSAVHRRAAREQDRPSTTWRPLQRFYNSVDDDFSRKVLGYTVNIGDLPLKEDGVTIRLRIRVFEKENGEATDTAETVGVRQTSSVLDLYNEDGAALGEDGEGEGPLCSLLSLPIIVRSSKAETAAAVAGLSSSSPVLPLAPKVDVSTAATAPITTPGASDPKNNSVTDDQSDQDVMATTTAAVALEPEDERTTADGVVLPRTSDLAVTSSSYAYWATDCLTPEQTLETEVFVDPGRCNQLVEVCVTPLSSLASTDIPTDPNDAKWAAVPPLTFSSAYMCRKPMVREVLVVDLAKDLRLACLVRAAKGVANGTMDVFARAQSLMWFTCGIMGGPTLDSDAAEDHLLSLRKSVDSQRSQDINDSNGKPASRRLRRTVKAAPKAVPTTTSNVVALGTIRWGLCRHRALLMKLLCDVYRVPCFLVRGDYVPDLVASSASTEGHALSGTATVRHSWNVIVTRGELWVADPTLAPFSNLQRWPHPQYISGAPLVPNFMKLHDLRMTASLRVTLMEECGSGVSAIVRRCTIGGLSCAIKLPRTDEDCDLLRQELTLMSRLSQCPSVVHVFGWRRGIVMEYVPLSLLSFINHLTLRGRRISRNQRVDVVLGVLTALEALHGLRYVHRDIKAENVLVAVNRCEECKAVGVYCDKCSLIPKLTDFADAVEIPANSAVHSSCPAVGTVPYAAPEVEAQAPFSFAADMWSLGILATELHLMELPREGAANVKGSTVLFNYFGAPQGAKNTSRVFVPKSREGHPRLAAVVAGCLEVDWRKRPTAAQARGMLDEKMGEN